MSDFDFDELDKAVAGALASDDSAETPAQLPSSENRDGISQQEDAQPQHDVAQDTSEEPTPRVAPAARRSSGRFMDVVHPSSDMRTRPAGFTPPSPTTSAPQDRPVAQAPTSNDDELTEESETESWAKPLESPFLPGAKVVKRPLGGEPAPTRSFDFEETPIFDMPDEPLLEAPDEPLLEATTMPDPIDFAAQAASLSSESEDTGSVQPSEAPFESVTFEETTIEEVPFEEIPTEETPVEEPISVETPSTPERPPQQHREVLESIGPASITQQYTEQPSSTEASGAIYDTEAYHQPVAAAPVKKHSGIWVFLWILLLIILGAGAGVAFYLFVLPNF